MAVLPILRWPDPRLSQAADPADPIALEQTVRDMFDTMYDAGGRGLAGPQVGVMARVFVMDAGWKQDDPEPRVMLNPVIMASENRFEVADEGCLSIPGVPVPVRRPVAVTVQWTDITGEIHMDDFDGFEARCIQHEMDHLAGLVVFDHLDPEARTALERPYLEANA